MTSSMVLPASCLRALVTSSPVSRAATDGLTGTFQARMAARTSPRAAATAAGPAVSVMRSLRGAAGRVSAIVLFIGVLPYRADGAGPGRHGSLWAAGPGGSIKLLTLDRAVATQILMQLAARDICHLTD